MALENDRQRDRVRGDKTINLKLTYLLARYVICLALACLLAYLELPQLLQLFHRFVRGGLPCLGAATLPNFSPQAPQADGSMSGCCIHRQYYLVYCLFGILGVYTVSEAVMNYYQRQ